MARYVKAPVNQTDDVEAAVTELRAAGVEILVPPARTAAGNVVAYVADPDGT